MKIPRKHLKASYNSVEITGISRDLTRFNIEFEIAKVQNKSENIQSIHDSF